MILNGDFYRDDIINDMNDGGFNGDVTNPYGDTVGMQLGICAYIN